MPRTETFCDGHLVKETARVDIGAPSRSEYIDGRWTWLLDGEEISDAEAEKFRTTWEAQHSR